jgi:hypothetical protein
MLAGNASNKDFQGMRAQLLLAGAEGTKIAKVLGFEDRPPQAGASAGGGGRGNDAGRKRQGFCGSAGRWHRGCGFAHRGRGQVGKPYTALSHVRLSHVGPSGRNLTLGAASDSGHNFVWVGRPGKGSWCGVVRRRSG